MNIKFNMTPKCTNCGSRYPIGNTNGMPNMIGFKLKDGKTINLCYKCMITLGSLPDDKKEEFINRL